MTVADALLIMVAALGAGATNTVVGAGTLITFPTLVALGLPPVTATMSDVVGLLGGKISGSWGYRTELRGQSRPLRWQVPAAVIGAVIGASLLTTLPESTFEGVAPIVLVLALILVLVGPKIQRWTKQRADGAGRSVDHVSMRRLVMLAIVTCLIAISGGYFPAALGILLIGSIGALLPEPIQRVNAVKNLLALLINVVAAVFFVAVASDRIDWIVVGLLAFASLVGGWLGARYGRRLSATALRIIVIVVGIIGLVRLLAL